MPDTSLCAQLSLTELSNLIASRRISPSEVVQDALARVRRLDPVVRAFITVTEDAALAHARQLDDEWSRGQLRGPLHGLPITYKDNIALAQTRTTANSRSHANWVPSQDAEVVSHLNQAGAVSLGKVMLWELAGGAPTPSALHPSPRNPWDLNHSPGGSSSGSGAAVAAGFGVGSVGTDTGGSIRNPAASCGLVGFKPTLGSVSTAGVIPLSKTLDHVGPITRTVADNLLMFAAMQPSGLDPATLDPTRYQTDSLRGMRLGVPWHMLEVFEYDEDCRTAFAEALRVLADLGAEILPIQLPTFEKASAWGGEITAMDAYDEYGRRMSTHPEEFEATFTARITQAKQLTEERRNWLRTARAQCLDEWQTVRHRVDIVVTPASRGVADSLDESLKPGYGPRAEYTRMYNVSGMPALAMPMGWSEGLPLSIQFAADYHQDAQIYRVALAYEAATGFTSHRPNL
ncbi:MAG: amidase [Pigmentiphaga sp.]|nr:amidase [Pigmentiphaga sp.]